MMMYMRHLNMELGRILGQTSFEIKASHFTVQQFVTFANLVIKPSFNGYFEIYDYSNVVSIITLQWPFLVV